MLRLLQQLASTESWSLRGDSHAARQRQPLVSLGKFCKPVPAQKASRTCIRPHSVQSLIQHLVRPASEGRSPCGAAGAASGHGNLCKPPSLVKAGHASSDYQPVQSLALAIAGILESHCMKLCISTGSTGVMQFIKYESPCISKHGSRCTQMFSAFSVTTGARILTP